MRTVKKTHNFKLREKGYAVRDDGFEISLCSENPLPKTQAVDAHTVNNNIAAGNDNPKKGKAAMGDEHTDAHS